MHIAIGKGLTQRDNQAVLNSQPLINTQRNLEPLLSKIANHNLFKNIKSTKELKTFTEHHVFAVWDFMCLLKSLQGKITCVTVPWFPPLDSLGSHLINDIMSEEEGDLTEDHRYLSHFEIYIEAMEKLQADTSGISRLLKELKSGMPIPQAIKAAHIPTPSQKFMESTFNIIEKKLHQITAAFVFGRENITYKMFQPILDSLDQTEKNRISTFEYYLKRHIELDQSSHEAKGLRLLQNLCDNDPIKWQEAEETAIYALEARITLLDGIYERI